MRDTTAYGRRTVAGLLARSSQCVIGKDAKVVAYTELEPFETIVEIWPREGIGKVKE